MQVETSFAEANKTKFPEQIAIAIARDPQGKYNPITLGWAMQTSIRPPMIAISVGHTRYSHEAIRTAGQFVIAFPPSELQEKSTMLFGTKSGRDMDKLAAAAAEVTPARHVDAVLLDRAVANFECKLAGQLDSGDHTIFVGEVVCSYVNDQPLARLYTLSSGHKLGPLGRPAAPDRQG